MIKKDRRKAVQQENIYSIEFKAQRRGRDAFDTQGMVGQ